MHIALRLGTGKCVTNKEGFKEDFQAAKQASSNNNNNNKPKDQNGPKALWPNCPFLWNPHVSLLDSPVIDTAFWQLSSFTSKVSFTLPMPAVCLPL